MKSLSVCSGIEAASVAWRPLGWKAVAFSEIEPFPCAVLAHHYPEVPNWGDMTKFQEWPDAAIDLLCGGTPCQSFSVAGLRKGLDDPRGNLMLTFGAIAARYRPRWLVWENVPGVLSSNGGRDFGSFLGLLGVLGYGFAYRVLDAQFAGVPQRRRRVFVVGCLGDWRSAAAVLLERHSLSGHPAPSRQARQAVASGLGAGSKRSGGRIGRREAAGNQLIPQAFGGNNTSGPIDCAAGLNAKGGAGRMDFDSETFVTAFDPTQITSATNRSNPQPGDPCHTLAKGQHAPAIAFAHQAGGTQTTLGYDPGSCTAPTLAANQTSAICFSAKDHGADATEDCAPTLRAGGHSASHANAGVMPAIAFQERGREDGRSLEVGGELAYALTAPKDGGRAQERNVLTPTMQVRRLTPEECEALQGFPRSYTAIPHRGKPAADGPRYKALGNSWAVPCARWIGERIQAVEAIAAMKEAA